MFKICLKEEYYNLFDTKRALYNLYCEIMVGFKNIEKRPSIAHSNFN